jgi:hypothetical protein
MPRVRTLSRHQAERIEAELPVGVLDAIRATMEALDEPFHRWVRVPWVAAYATNTAIFARVSRLQRTGLSQKHAIGRTVAALGLTHDAVHSLIYRSREFARTPSKKVA